jgi:hypothetical protein
VLRKDYVPQASNLDLAEVNILLNPDDNSILFKEEPKTGIYITTCIINGYNEEFAYDRGSDPMISLDKALDLLRWGAISKDDFEGDPEKILADNTIADRAIINFREINVANKSVENIQVRVNHKLRYDLVFGERLMSQFGKFTYNRNTKLLTIE